MSLIEELGNLSDTIKEFQDLNEPDTETFCFEPFIGLLGFKRTPADMKNNIPPILVEGIERLAMQSKKMAFQS